MEKHGIPSSLVVKVKLLEGTLKEKEESLGEFVVLFAKFEKSLVSVLEFLNTSTSYDEDIVGGRLGKEE